MFQLADASLLPVVGQNLAQSKAEYASLLMAGLIVVPQIVVALLSPWVGYHSEKWGRKPLLLLGFGLEIVRVVLFAFSADASILLIAQVLGGISAAAVTVLTVLMITDLTTGTGRFNLVRGSVGTLLAIAASISTTATGFMFERLGHWAGFLILAAISLIARPAVGGHARDQAGRVSRLVAGFLNQNENGPDGEPFSQNLRPVRAQRG